MKKLFLFFIAVILLLSSSAQQNIKLKKKDRKRDVELVTTEGTIILRLSDSTPLHRDNFLRLVKSHFYDSVLFHRVIQNFMIQSGDPNSKRAIAGLPLGNGGPSYTVPAEFRQSLFHKKGALAAARQGDNINPLKASSSSQFYIVHGKTFTDEQLDSVEIVRLNGRKLSKEHRDFYKSFGGTPQLDQNYTVFGELVKGYDVLEKIAQSSTSKGADKDRPLQDIRIINMKLIKRKKL